MAKKKDKWIQRMDLKEGALTQYIKKRFGNAGFTKSGTIKKNILMKLKNDPKVSTTIKRRVNLALKFKQMAKKKAKKKRRK